MSKQRIILAKLQSTSANDLRMSEEAQQMQFPSILAAGGQTSTTFSGIQLQALMMRYHVLDTIALMNPDVIKSRMDSICTEPPSRSLADSMASIHTTTPRPWLAIRRMIRECHPSVLHAILNVLSDALLRTNDILHTESREYALTDGERKVLEAPFYDCIKARRFVVVLLRDDIRAFIAGFAFPNAHATLTMTPQNFNIIPYRFVGRIESKTCPVETQGSTAHCAVRVARACTFFPLDIFGELVQIKIRSISSYCPRELFND